MSRTYEVDGRKIPVMVRVAHGYQLTLPKQIEHSGCMFKSNLWSMRYDHAQVWPIEELLARKTYRPEQAQRIRKLNPYGKPEGESCVLFEERR